MRTTVDIPDEIYRSLKTRAARKGTSVKQLILERVTEPDEPLILRPPQKPLRFPLVSSKEPGTMKLGEEGVYEFIPFP